MFEGSMIGLQTKTLCGKANLRATAAHRICSCVRKNAIRIKDDHGTPPPTWGSPPRPPHPQREVSLTPLTTRFERGFFLPSPEAVPTTASGIFHLAKVIGQSSD